MRLQCGYEATSPDWTVLELENLRKEFQKKVRQRIRPLLKDAGFNEFSELTAWRHASRWIDCVQLLTLSANEFGYARYLGPGVNATGATFQLCVGTYYLDIHSLPWIGDPPKRPRFPRGEAAKHPTVHRHRYLVRPYDRANYDDAVWLVAHDGSNLESVVESA